MSSFELYTLQYATLTDKAAEDFATIEGLAESWEESNDGLTYTYTLREGLQWSDGEPLTAEDIAYTINRSRDEEWLNHSATTANLEATAIDERTVEITSSVPDPKLPTMDVYIVPKHIYEDLSADEVTTYDGLDGVGSGPYTLEDWSPGQSWTMVANPNYYGWGDDGPEIDRVVFRVFDNGDAMVAALQRGEIDAAHLVPPESFEGLDADPDIVAIEGLQGGFTELGMNAGAGGIGDGHPALLDPDVRHTIAMAIDRDLLFDRVALELGERGTTVSPSADPSWQPEEVPADIALDFDPAAANALLDEAGYVDTDGDGVREMPDGSRDLTFRYAERSESENEPALREFITGWLADIGIATEVSSYDDTQLTTVIGEGNHDLFTWGWTPFVDPDRCCRTSRAPRSPRTPPRWGTTTPTGAMKSTTRCTRSRTPSSTPSDGGRSSKRCCSGSTPRAPTSCCSRTLICRRTAPTASRGGHSSRPRSVRCSSPTLRPATSTSPRPATAPVAGATPRCGSRWPRAPFSCSRSAGSSRCVAGQARKSANSTGRP